LLVDLFCIRQAGSLRDESGRMPELLFAFDCTGLKTGVNESRMQLRVAL
jgi:hypothetical protein